MARSLSELCSRPGVASFVLQGDRRQIADRRKVRRGGRRADDVEPINELDMRAIAIRRVIPNSRTERAEPMFTPFSDTQRHRVMMSAVRRTSE